MPKILIVEHNEESRAWLTGRLQCSGFAIVVADNGKNGLALAATEKPDLILMTMNMPEMDGWETVRQLKLDAGDASPPILALTEHLLPGDRERALAVGCTACQDKPIEFAELLQQIETLLQSRPAAATVCCESAK